MPPQPPAANSQHRGLLGLPLPSGAGCAGSEEKHGPIHLDTQPDMWSRARQRDRDGETEGQRPRLTERRSQRNIRATHRLETKRDREA